MAFSQDNDIILITLEGTGNPTVYAPIASHTVKGIASFSNRDFIVEGGHVLLKLDVVSDIENLQANKVDKVTDSGGPRAYVQTGVAQSVIPVSDDYSDENAIVRRAGHQIKVPDVPNSSNDAISKFWLDEETGELKTYIDTETGELKTYIDTEDEKRFATVSYAASTGVLTFKNKAGVTLGSVDLPLELIVESGYYDEDTKKLMLVLANGDEIEISVSDIFEDLATKEYVDSELETKQNVLIAGTNITIENNVISSTGGGEACVCDAILDTDGKPILDTDGNVIRALEIKSANGLSGIGTLVTNTIDLSDDNKVFFGTVQNPITVSETTDLSFVNYVSKAGFIRSFVLCIKRTVDVAVTWQNITKWAYDEIPLLPVGKVQKILVETIDGINYYGTGGDYFNV